MQKLFTILLFAIVPIHAEIRVVQQLELIEQAFESCGKNTLALFDSEQVNGFSSIISLARKNGAWLVALSYNPYLEDLAKFDQIIKTDASPYGPVLEEYFETLTIYPGNVIFIDSREDQIQSIHAVCASRNIACAAFHLTSH
jgi:hypothetical protein